MLNILVFIIVKNMLLHMLNSQVIDSYAVVDQARVALLIKNTNEIWIQYFQNYTHIVKISYANLQISTPSCGTDVVDIFTSKQNGVISECIICSHDVPCTDLITKVFMVGYVFTNVTSTNFTLSQQNWFHANNTLAIVDNDNSSMLFFDTEQKNNSAYILNSSLNVISTFDLQGTDMLALVYAEHVSIMRKQSQVEVFNFSSTNVNNSAMTVLFVGACSNRIVVLDGNTEQYFVFSMNGTVIKVIQNNQCYVGGIKLEFFLNKTSTAQQTAICFDQQNALVISVLVTDATGVTEFANAVFFIDPKSDTDNFTLPLYVTKGTPIVNAAKGFRQYQKNDLTPQGYFFSLVNDFQINILQLVALPLGRVCIGSYMLHSEFKINVSYAIGSTNCNMSMVSAANYDQNCAFQGVNNVTNNTTNTTNSNITNNFTNATNNITNNITNITSDNGTYYYNSCINSQNNINNLTNCNYSCNNGTYYFNTNCAYNYSCINATNLNSNCTYQLQVSNDTQYNGSNATNITSNGTLYISFQLIHSSSQNIFYIHFNDTLSPEQMSLFSRQMGVSINNQDPASYQYTITQSGNDALQLTLNLSAPVAGNPLITVQMQEDQFQMQAYNITLQNRQASAVLQDYIILSNDQKKTNAQVGLAAKVGGAFASMFSALSCTFQGGSGSNAITMLGLIQLIQYTRPEFPPNVEETFGNNNQFPPQLFDANSIIKADVPDVLAQAYKFQILGASPYLIDNTIQSLAQIILLTLLGFVIAKLHSRYGARVRKANQSLGQKVLNVLLRFIVWNNVYVMIFSAYIQKGILFSWIHVFYSSAMSDIGKKMYPLNILIALVCLLLPLHIYLIIKTCWMIKSYMATVSNKQRKRFSRVEIGELVAVQQIKKNIKNSPQDQTDITAKQNMALVGARRKSMNLQKQMSKFFQSQPQPQKNNNQQKEEEAESKSVLKRAKEQYLKIESKVIHKAYLPVKFIDKEQYLQKYILFYGELNKESAFQQYYLLLNLLRVYFITFNIAAFQNYMVTQAVLNVAVLAIFLTITNIYRPYRSKYVFILNNLAEACIFLAFFLAVLLAVKQSRYNSMGTLTQDQQKTANDEYYSFGKLFVLTVLGMTYVTFLMMIVPVLLLFKGVYSYLMKKKGIDQIEKEAKKAQFFNSRNKKSFNFEEEYDVQDQEFQQNHEQEDQQEQGQVEVNVNFEQEKHQQQLYDDQGEENIQSQQVHAQDTMSESSNMQIQPRVSEFNHTLINHTNSISEIESQMSQEQNINDESQDQDISLRSSSSIQK